MSGWGRITDFTCSKASQPIALVVSQQVSCSCRGVATADNPISTQIWHRFYARCTSWRNPPIWFRTWDRHCFQWLRFWALAGKRSWSFRLAEEKPTVPLILGIGWELNPCLPHGRWETYHWVWALGGNRNKVLGKPGKKPTVPLIFPRHCLGIKPVPSSWQARNLSLSLGIGWESNPGFSTPGKEPSTELLNPT